MTIDLEEIERLAVATTAIDWTFEGPTKDAFIAAANPAVVLELIERLRAAEAIVRDLADNDPVVDPSTLSDYLDVTCGLCGKDEHETSAVVDDNHKVTCPYRRAVTLTHAQDAAKLDV